MTATFQCLQVLIEIHLFDFALKVRSNFIIPEGPLGSLPAVKKIKYETMFTLPTHVVHYRVDSSRNE